VACDGPQKVGLMTAGGTRLAARQGRVLKQLADFLSPLPRLSRAKAFSEDFERGTWHPLCQRGLRVRGKTA
jgi:hypothetical protein